MRNPKKTWESNLKNIKTLHGLHRFLSTKLQAADVSDILRAEYVLLVSAFDCYIHDIVLYGMVEIFSGKDVSNSHYDDFQVPLSLVGDLINEKDYSLRSTKYNSAVKRILSKNSFQSPQSIEYALGLLGHKKIWTKISNKIGCKSIDLRNELSLIIHRRNMIAHEADIKDLMSSDKNPIDRNDVEQVISFLERIIDTIEDLNNMKTKTTTP